MANLYQCVCVKGDIRATRRRVRWVGLLLWIISCATAAAATPSQWTIEALPGYPAGPLPFKLETGYIGVGDMDEVQFFYYFIESESDPTKDPLMVWISGGPGCSSLSGLLFEIGPLAFNYTTCYEGDLPSFQLNPYSWTKVASIIFLDSPVGTGFSYSTTSKGYYSNTTLSTHHTHEFLRKWLSSHPQFLANQFYVGGDSYSGLPVPMVVELIVLGNEMGLKPFINLRGYVEGNPLTDDNSDSNARLKYAHRVSLISDELYQSAVKSCHGEYVNADPDNAQCQKVLHTIDDCIFHGVYIMHVLEPDCAAASPKPRNILQLDPRRVVSDEDTDLLYLRRRRSTLQAEVPELWCRSYNYLPTYAWTNDKRVRETLHIREGTKEQWDRCNKTITNAFTIDINNTVPNHRRLTNRFLHALIYSGDQDLLIPYVATLEWIKSLPLRVTSSWRPWFVQGQVAGYTTQYSNMKYHLTFATLKGAGHTAPEYRPKEALAMIANWFADYPL